MITLGIGTSQLTLGYMLPLFLRRGCYIAPLRRLGFSARAHAWCALLIGRPASPFRSSIGCSAFNNRRPFFVDMRTCRTYKAPRTSFHSHPPKIPGSSRYCISTPPPLVFGRSKEILTALFVETRMFHPHKAAASEPEALLSWRWHAGWP